MKKILFACLIFCANMLQAQDLKFDPQGKFKIVQFTDVHYVHGTEASNYSLKMMKNTLDQEKPNLVVFTGDIVVGKDQAALSWDTVLELVISRNIPYLVTFGNHDDEGEWKRNQIAEYVTKKKLLVNKQATISGVDGFLNASVAIKNNKDEQAAIIYIMDSHAYSTIPKVKGYGWFSSSQVNWFKEESKKYKIGRQDTLPALAFFHIPLPEYNIAFNDMKNKRIGVRYETECAPAINTGMYAAMLESGDVMGTFVGHDHVNDYLVNYYGIGLAYGCFSGSANTYQRVKNGARIIELTAGKRSFDTYIREYDGQILYQSTFPFK